MNHLRRQWFLYTLLTLIPAGMFLGQIPAFEQQISGVVNTQVVVFFTLYCMSSTLRLGQWTRSLSKPAGVLLATLINSFLMPLAAWGLFACFSQSPLSAGILIAGIVPCTLASAAVWTRRAEGNDAIPLIVTLLTNGLCFLLIPWWLWMTLGQMVPVESGKLMSALLITAVLPMFLGQLSRLIPALQRRIDRNQTLIGVLAQLGVLFMVWVGALKTGPVLSRSASAISPAMFFGVFFACVLLHVMGLILGWFLSRLANFRADAIGVMFSGSQKHCRLQWIWQLRLCCCRQVFPL